jgi:hypothetical protein
MRCSQLLSTSLSAALKPGMISSQAMTFPGCLEAITTPDRMKASNVIR